MTSIAVRDASLYYEDTGDGPPVLFIHGASGGAWVWQDQVERLSPSLRCVTYDRRGHSRSTPGQGGQSNTTHADDAAALIDALGLRPCLLVASSGGACIGLELVLRHPHLLRGAVLSEPPQGSLDPIAGSALMADIAGPVSAAEASGGPRAAADAFFAAVCPGLWAIADEPRKDRYRDNAEVLLAGLQSPATQITPADLDAVTLPVLVIAGADSHPALRTIAHVLADSLPDARLIEIPDCGHVTYAEQPATFARAVRAFAGELAPSP
ncbi:MAG: alpha/beta hydrolase, partial [Actinomycetota bacterium]